MEKLSIKQLKDKIFALNMLKGNIQVVISETMIGKSEIELAQLTEEDRTPGQKILYSLLKDAINEIYEYECLIDKCEEQCVFEIDSFNLKEVI